MQEQTKVKNDPIEVAYEIYKAHPVDRFCKDPYHLKSYFANKNVFSDLKLEDVPHPPRK